MPREALLAVACAVTLTGCGSTPRAVPTEPDAPVAAVARPVAPGTILRLQPTAVAASGAPVSAGFVDALLREALRLSDRFDIAAALEDVDAAPFALRPRIDAAASTLTLALVPADPAEPAVPLASASYREKPLPSAIDELAWQARRALGETVAEPPAPSALIYSASPTCVRETEAALLDENRGLHGSRRERLERARRSDPGCTVTIAIQAATALIAGQRVEAVRLAETALEVLPERLSPNTEHRLRRVLWLARAATARDSGDAVRADETLLDVAERYIAERPFDPHGRYTRALANSNLGRFDAAIEDLRFLRDRWPEIPWVAYHLAFAEIATGDPEAALDQLEAGARRLSAAWTLLPRALALYEAGHHEELSAMLERLASRRRGRTDDVTMHEIRRMQAAHALLTDRDDEAARHLLDDIEWLRERPSLLDRLAEDLADDGAALVALGRGEELAVRLAALRALPADEPRAEQVLTFLEGLVAIGRDDQAVARAEASLRANGRPDTAARLTATQLLEQGDAAGAVERLETAQVLADDPRLAALLASALAEAGREKEAEETAAIVRDRLGTLRLRGPLLHPLLGPGSALAWRRAGGLAPRTD